MSIRRLNNIDQAFLMSKNAKLASPNSPWTDSDYDEPDGNPVCPSPKPSSIFLSGYTPNYFGDVKLDSGVACNLPDEFYTDPVFAGELLASGGSNCNFTSGATTYYDFVGSKRWGLTVNLQSTSNSWLFSLIFARQFNLSGLPSPSAEIRYRRYKPSPFGQYFLDLDFAGNGLVLDVACYVIRSTIFISES